MDKSSVSAVLLPVVAAVSRRLEVDFALAFGSVVFVVVVVVGAKYIGFKCR